MDDLTEPIRDDVEHPDPEPEAGAPASQDDDAFDLDEPPVEAAEESAPPEPESEVPEPEGEPAEETAPPEPEPEPEAEMPEPEGEPAEETAPPEPEAEVPGEIALAREPFGSRLPFWVYGAVWLVFTALMAFLIWPSATTAFVGTVDYGIFVYGGAGLLVGGLVLGLVVWLTSRNASAGEPGMVRAIALRTVGWMAVGVLLWWGGLILLDLHRLGVIR